MKSSKSDRSRDLTLPICKRDSNGFSHLEWSASVPYNLAEEPDEVTGMKHSHSCQSMPSLSLEELASKQNQKANDTTVKKLNQIEEQSGDISPKNKVPADFDSSLSSDDYESLKRKKANVKVKDDVETSSNATTSSESGPALLNSKFGDIF